ncbi:MAG: mycothiol synthase [Ornithinimicrobium sp.]|uniref:mycothiol synthase n=1 Tax=Ornithinimicrobium sp. TaxID=1977084 RepID=UPI0017DE176B|nr:mycothiol synthase [Actinomycetota bacterium]
MDVTTERVLPPRQGADVLALAVRARTRDDVRALSEQTVLDVRRLPEEGGADPQTTHLLVLDRAGEIDAKVLGYAHVDHHEQHPTVELVVHPDERRAGIGTMLAQAVLQQWPTARCWAHGHLPEAQALAGRLGLRVVRELWQMSRPLRGEWSELPEAPVPEGFAVRSFEVGADEQGWLAVNARAFAQHAEQGRMTRSDLRDRMHEPWFDPHGFLLVEDVRDEGAPRLAGFHWTKVEPAAPGSSTPVAGEVYVVGVDPAYQGQGLGLVTTVLGLRHLRACGLATATLYVDGDNAAAVATYHRLGFERSAVDVMYARYDGAGPEH